MAHFNCNQTASKWLISILANTNDSTLESNTTYIQTLSNVQYIRIKVNTANTTPGYFSIYELEANNTADVTPVPVPSSFQENYAPYASINATTQDNNYPVGDTNDEVYLNNYHSGNNPGFPQYITLNWAAGKSISEVALTVNNGLTSGPTNFDVEVSADGSTNWTTVGSTGNFNWQTTSLTETQYVTFPAIANRKGLRIKINSANLANSFITVAEVEANSIATPPSKRRVVGSNSNLAFSAAASSTGSNPTYPASNLNDSNLFNGVVSVNNPTFPQYQTLVWNTGQTFNNVVMKCWFSQGQGPTTWDIEVSDDGSTNWTSVASSGTVNWTTNTNNFESKAISFPMVTNKKGVRIKVNSANLTWSHFAIQEIEVYKINYALTATATSTGANPASPASNLNDALTSVGLVSIDNPTLPQYETLTWSTGQSFSSVDLLSWFSQGQAPTSWDIEVSTDGTTNWTLVASSGTVSWASNNSTIETKTVSFTPVTDKKGLRIKVKTANLTWGHFAIQELEVN